jgi:hypothetical protein
MSVGSRRIEEPVLRLWIEADIHQGVRPRSRFNAVDERERYLSILSAEMKQETRLRPRNLVNVIVELHAVERDAAIDLTSRAQQRCQFAANAKADGGVSFYGVQLNDYVDASRLDGQRQPIQDRCRNRA